MGGQRARRPAHRHRCSGAADVSRPRGARGRCAQPAGVARPLAHSQPDRRSRVRAPFEATRCSLSCSLGACASDVRRELSASIAHPVSNAPRTTVHECSYSDCVLVLYIRRASIGPKSKCDTCMRWTPGAISAPASSSRSATARPLCSNRTLDSRTTTSSIVCLPRALLESTGSMANLCVPLLSFMFSSQVTHFFNTSKCERSSTIIELTSGQRCSETARTLSVLRSRGAARLTGQVRTFN